MADKTYFSWSNFSELAGLEAHLAFASSVINKHKWEPQARRQLQADLQRINEKQRDSQLNMSVIGEFATGKSTFINALLRADLLAASALQGTTVATTVIEYSTCYSIDIEMLDGKHRTHKFGTAMELHDALEDFTTNPLTARQLHVVRVGLPSENLKRGLRIIDTPGTNAIEQWHEDVTRTAIREFSDLSVILVDATRPLPDTLTAFIQANLADVLPQCVFVITKIDLLPRRERSRMVSYVQKKLSLIGCPKALVLPYVSVEVMNTFVPGYVKQSDTELLQDSLVNEEQLFRHTGQQRLKAQARKLIALTSSMYANLQQQVSNIRGSYEQELELLKKSQQTDLAPFIREQKGKREKAYILASNDKKISLQNDVYKWQAEARANIHAKIDSFTTLDNLNDYVKGSLTTDCQAEAEAMINKCEASKMVFKKCYYKEMKAFQKEFEKLFTDLKILRVDFSKTAITQTQVATASATSLSAASAFTADEVSKENWTIVGGIAAGAALGAAVFGVGAVVGGIIGGIWGLFKGPDINKVKAELKDVKLKAPLDSYFNKVVNDIIDYQNRYQTSLASLVKTEIERYLSTYQDIVRQRISQQEKQRKTVESQIDLLNKQMSEIETRRQSLESIGQQINN